MAKKNAVKENPVTDALRKLKDEEAELLGKLKPVQEAISALEAIIGKPAKKESGNVRESAGHRVEQEPVHD